MAFDGSEASLNDSFSKVSGSVETLLRLLEKSKKESLELAAKSSDAQLHQLSLARRDDAVIIDHVRQIVLVMSEQQKLIVRQKNAIESLEKRLVEVEAEFSPKRPLLGKSPIEPKGS